MKKHILLVFLTIPLIYSCGSSARFASSGFDDAVYYRPSVEGREYLLADKAEVDDLIKRTVKEAASYADTIIATPPVTVDAYSNIADYDPYWGYGRGFGYHGTRWDFYDNWYWNYSFGFGPYISLYWDPFYGGYFSGFWGSPWGPWGPYWGWYGWYDPFWGHYYPGFYPGHPYPHDSTPVYYGKRDSKRGSSINTGATYAKREPGGTVSQGTIVRKPINSRDIRTTEKARIVGSAASTAIANGNASFVYDGDRGSVHRPVRREGTAFEHSSGKTANRGGYRSFSFEATAMDGNMFRRDNDISRDFRDFRSITGDSHRINGFRRVNDREMRPINSTVRPSSSNFRQSISTTRSSGSSTATRSSVGTARRR